MPARLRISFFAFTIIFIQTILNGTAQYLNLNAGVSTAVSDFGKKDISNPIAGFASYGPHFNASFITNHHRKFLALGAEVFYNENGTEFGPLVDNMNTMFHKQFTLTNIEPWSSFGGLIGLFVFTTTDEYYPVQGYFKLMMGAHYASSPSYSIATDSIFLKQLSNSTLSPLYIFGAGLILQAEEKVSFVIHVDYYYSNPDFGIIQASNSSGTKFNLGSTNAVQPIKVINATIGMMIRLQDYNIKR